MFAGGIGLGRPYLPIAVPFLGLLSIAFIGSEFPGLAEWLEKLSMILSVASLIGEYLYIGIWHWIQKNQKKKIIYLFILITVCSIILSYVCYVYFLI